MAILTNNNEITSKTNNQKVDMQFDCPAILYDVLDKMCSISDLIEPNDIPHQNNEAEEQKSETTARSNQKVNKATLCNDDSKQDSTSDAVNHPAHYTYGTIETIDYIEDKGFTYNLGNAIKYISRAGHKLDAIEDLKKAVWYVEREIQRLQKGNKNA